MNSLWCRHQSVFYNFLTMERVRILFNNWNANIVTNRTEPLPDRLCNNVEEFSEYFNGRASRRLCLLVVMRNTGLIPPSISGQPFSDLIDECGKVYNDHNLGTSYFNNSPAPAYLPQNNTSYHPYQNHQILVDDEPVRPQDAEEEEMPPYMIIARSKLGGNHQVAPTVDVETSKQALSCMTQYAQKPSYANHRLGIFILVKEASAEQEEIEVEAGAATFEDSDEESNSDMVPENNKQKEIIFKAKLSNNKKKGKKMMIDGEVIGDTHMLHDIIIICRKFDPVNKKKVIYEVHTPMNDEMFDDIEETEAALTTLVNKYPDRTFAVYTSHNLKKEKTTNVNIKSRAVVKMAPRLQQVSSSAFSGKAKK